MKMLLANRCRRLWTRGKRVVVSRICVNKVPAIAVNDLDWSQGRKLTAFHVDGPGTSNGRSLRVPVTLTVLQPSRGTAKKVTATYAIGVDPSVVIVRETEGD